MSAFRISDLLSEMMTVSQESVLVGDLRTLKKPDRRTP
jgi:hypothetical protein